MKKIIVSICMGMLLLMVGCVTTPSDTRDDTVSAPQNTPTPTPPPDPPVQLPKCTYTVRKGDCISEIAEQFYGTTKKCDTINPLMEFNNIKRAKDLMPGQPIKLPVITCANGATLTPKCDSPFSASRSSTSKYRRVDNCQSIKQNNDFLLYTLRKGDTIQKLAYRFYEKRSDCDTVAKLKAFNRIRRPDKMMPGDQIQLPVIYCREIDRHLKPKCMRNESPSTPTPRPAALPKAFRDAINLYISADFEKAEKKFLILMNKTQKVELRQLALIYRALIAGAYDNIQDIDRRLKEIIKLNHDTELEDLILIAPELAYHLGADIRGRYQHLKRQSER